MDVRSAGSANSIKAGRAFLLAERHGINLPVRHPFNKSTSDLKGLAVPMFAGASSVFRRMTFHSFLAVLSCFLSVSTSLAAEKYVDLKKSNDLLLWKSAEGQSIGSLTTIQNRLIYAVSDSDQLREFLGSKKGSTRFPNQEKLLTLLLRTNLRCRNAANGDLLWNATMESAGNLRQYPIGPPPLSAPAIAAGRVFVQTAEGQVVALNLAGFADQKNKGPFRWEQNRAANAPDILWIRDLQTDLKVVPRSVGDVGANIASPLAIGTRIYCTTGNAGVYQTSEDDYRNPAAPAFVALSAADGSVLWVNSDPSPAVDFYQNASPFLVSQDADPKIIGFPGGDGYIYLLDSKTGKAKTRLACFSTDSRPWTKDTMGTRNFFSIAPTVALPYLLTCPGWTIETATMGRENRRTPVFSYKMGGDSSAALAWSFDEPGFLGSMSPLLVHGDEVYILGLPDRLIVLDLSTGAKKREAKLPSGCQGHAGMAVWGTRLIVCLEDGFYVLANDAELTMLAYLNPGETPSIFSQPIVEGDRLTVSSWGTVWVISLPELEKLLR